MHGGNAASSMGCSSLDRAEVLSSTGCMLCTLLSGQGAYAAPTAQPGCTHCPAGGHPTPSRGARCSLARSLLSGHGWEPPRLCGPVQVSLPASPRSPGSPTVPLPAQGRRGQARCVLLARRQLSALGTSRFPASAAKEPSLPKLLRAAETVPGKASAGAAPPPASRAELRPGSEPPPSPSLGVSSPHCPQPLHPWVTGGAWHSVPVGAAGSSAQVQDEG